MTQWTLLAPLVAVHQCPQSPPELLWLLRTNAPSSSVADAQLGGCAPEPNAALPAIRIPL